MLAGDGAQIPRWPPRLGALRWRKAASLRHRQLGTLIVHLTYGVYQLDVMQLSRNAPSGAGHERDLREDPRLPVLRLPKAC